MERLIDKAHKLSDTQEMSRSRMLRLQLYNQKKVEYNHGSQPTLGDRSAHRSKTSGQPVHKKFTTYTALIANRKQILNTIANE